MEESGTVKPSPARSAIYRIHLSTCFILMVAASMMLGANLVSHAEGWWPIGWGRPTSPPENLPHKWCEKCEQFHPVAMLEGRLRIGWPMEYADGRRSIWCDKCKGFHERWFSGDRAFANTVACVGLLLLLGAVVEHLVPTLFSASRLPFRRNAGSAPIRAV